MLMSVSDFFIQTELSDKQFYW